MSFTMNATAESLQPRPDTAARAHPAPPPSPMPLPLAKALDYAAKITDWIAPHCRQIEPAGELRRRCATCAAIDLLVIPRFEAQANLLFNFLDAYVQNEPMGRANWRHDSGHRHLRGLAPAHHDDTATLFLPRCTLVLHVATPDTWFLRLFEATGSPAHLQTIRQRIRSLPGTWEPGEMIRVRNKSIQPVSEGHIYDVLNMSWLPPWKRLA